jgi:hypothetical protein
MKNGRLGNNVRTAHQLIRKYAVTITRTVEDVRPNSIHFIPMHRLGLVGILRDRLCLGDGAARHVKGGTQRDAVRTEDSHRLNTIFCKDYLLSSVSKADTSCTDIDYYRWSVQISRASRKFPSCHHLQVDVIVWNWNRWLNS